MQPEIRELSAKKLIAVEKRGLVNNNFNRAADQAFTALNKFVSQNRLFGSVEHCLGICPDDGVSTDAKDARYIAAYFLRDGAKVWARGDVMELEFPAGRYAVFTHKGPYENLWQTWNRIYRDWLPSSGEQLRDAVPFEVYINEKSETPPEKLLVEIFVPIQ